MVKEYTDHKAYQKKDFESAHAYLKPADTYYIAHLVTTLMSKGEIRKNTPLLEVGCGMGRFTFKLLQLGYRVVGVDLSQSMLDRLSKHTGANDDFSTLCLDVDELGKRFPALYEQVIGFFILHHVPDLAVTFRAIYDCLKPGGRIAFLEPNPWNPLYYLRFLFWRDQTWEAEKGYLNMTRRKMFGAMEKAGFINIKRFRFGFFPPFITNTNWGYALEMRMERIRWLNGVLPFQIFIAEKNAYKT